MTRGPTIPDLLAARAEADPQRPAIQLVAGGVLTFAAWLRRSQAVAYGIRQRGVAEGDRVCLVFEGADWIEFAVAYCGVLTAGAVAVPVPSGASPEETRHIFRSCAATMAIGPSVPRPTSSTPPVVSTVSVAALESGAGSPPPTGLAAARPTPTDLAQILYTSGTTGRPKGVAATHANLTFGCQLRPRRRIFTHSEHFIHAFPIGTNAAQMMLLNAIVAHPAALVVDHFDADTFCAAIARFTVGTAFVVPAMAAALLDSTTLPRYDLSSVLMLSSSGSALPPSVARGLTKVFGNATVINAYTSTEAMPAQVAMMVDPDRPDSVGLPLQAAAIRILGPDGAELPAGETGEVWLRCPTGPRSYYGDPDATAGTFRDGWVRMGDLGRLDDDGRLYLVDRASDVIQCGAMRVSTIEVEAALQEHPRVREAAVLGLPHPVMGAMVAAAVVLDDGAALRDVRTFLRGRIAGHKVPVRWMVLDALPRNPMGKVAKPDIRPLFAAARPDRAGR